MVNLLRHLTHGIVVLLAEVNEGRLVLDVRLLQVTAQLGQLSLSLLVQLNLSCCGATGFIQALAQLLQFPAQVSFGLFCLCSGLSLVLQLFLQFLNTSLEFLDLLLELGDETLLILEFGGERGNFLVLSLNGLLEFLLVTFEICNGFLC